MLAPEQKKYKKYRKEPRLTANQLADYYTTASPPQRTNIMVQAKFPQGVVTAHYDEAKNALRKHLSDQKRSTQILHDALTDIEKKKLGFQKPWKENDLKLSAEAIGNFLKAGNTLGISRFNFSAVTSDLPHLNFEGTDVSINLDLVTYRTDADGTKRVGGVIFMFSKSDKNPNKRQKRGKSASWLILQTVEKHMTQLGVPDPKLCIVIDVFEGKVYSAATGNKLMKSHLEACCKEVAIGWDHVPIPSDYDGPPVL